MTLADNATRPSGERNPAGKLASTIIDRYGAGSLTQQTVALSIADVTGKTRETRLNEEGQARQTPYLTYNNLIGWTGIEPASHCPPDNLLLAVYLRFV